MSTVRNIGGVKMKRAELHLHTKQSDNVSLISAGEIIARAKEWGLSAIAFTNLNNLQDFPEISKYAEKTDLKIIYGAELYKDEKNKITLIAKNNDGIKELYKVISSLDENKVVDMEVLRKNRKNLLVGSAGREGELFSAFACEKTENLEEIAVFYDYFEIYPAVYEEEEEINKRIYELGEELGVRTVAVSNAHYLSENDVLCRDIIRETRNMPEETCFDLRLLTTEELLKEFSHLGQRAAEEVVINNTTYIADLTEPAAPLKKGFFEVGFGNDFETVEKICIEKAFEIYNSPLPEAVADRLYTELDLIEKNNTASMYLVAYKMAANLKENSHIFSVRGALGSAFVSFLLGVSEFNPLPAHYYCDECCVYEETDEAQMGVELKAQNCPKCDKPLKSDGFNLPYEGVMGSDGSRMPDLNFNLTKGGKKGQLGFIKELFGEGRVAFGGTVASYIPADVDRMLKEYEKAKHLAFTNEQVQQITEKISGVKKTEGAHPVGIMIVPKGMEYEDFSPLKQATTQTPVTHFDFHALHNTLLKIDLLTSTYMEQLDVLKRTTGVDPSEIRLDSPEIFEFLKSGDTVGIVDFDKDFMKELAVKLAPDKISDLVKISGFAHGTCVWTDNGEYLIDKDIPIQSIPTTYDDVMNDLLSVGVSRADAFEIASVARRGLLTRDRVSEEKRKHYKTLCKPLGDWYFTYLCRVRYMFPKVHALIYVAAAIRLAWYKKHYPKEFGDAYHYANIKENL